MHITNYLAKAAFFSLNKLDRLVEAHPTDHTKIVVKGSNVLPLKVGSQYFVLDSDVELGTATDLDTGAVAAGTNYYVYALDNAGVLAFVLSANSTYPDGYTAANSRKIGGFHTLSASVGTIAGHTLSGYLANDILPASIWDLKHRPVSNPEGMVYVDVINKWVDIYLASGTGVNTASVNGGTISDNRTWLDFVDDFAAVKKSLLDDSEFQAAAAGSNEETNITGSADPVTTGPHTDTAGRRMISNYGIEDACGVMWQWLDEQGYRFDGAANHTHAVTVSGDPETVNTGNPSGDVAPAFGYYDLPGAKGSLYRQGTYGDVKVHAGGSWDIAAIAGSRARRAHTWRWPAGTYLGGRGRAEPI